jgi:small ligand-binding sensory domain FIST
VQNDAVPDDITNLSQEECFKALFGTTPELPSINDTDDISTAVCLLPSPAFLNQLDDFLNGLQVAIPVKYQTFGAVASTVSSLSRARLFQYSKTSNTEPLLREDDLYTHGRGCVGVMFRGDIQVDILIARGAKPVGGIYRIGDGEESKIRSLILDSLRSCRR